MPTAKVYVTLKPSLLDAQGRAVQGALTSLGYDGVKQVRIGKLIEIELSDGKRNVKRDVDEMCRKLLANPVIENYRVEVSE